MDAKRMHYSFLLRMQENGFKGKKDEIKLLNILQESVCLGMLKICTKTFYYGCKKTDSKEKDEIKLLNILQESVCLGMLTICSNP